MRAITRLSGWWVFAGLLLLIAGALNIIYGVAAIGHSTLFTASTVYIRDFRLWGWFSLILGVCEWAAAYSLWNGGEFGRWFGIIVASLNAVGVLLTIATYPFWSLAIFALCIIIIYKLAEGPEVIVS